MKILKILGYYTRGQISLENSSKEKKEELGVRYKKKFTGWLEGLLPYIIASGAV